MSEKAPFVFPNGQVVERMVRVGGLCKAELLAAFQKNHIQLNAYGKTLFEAMRETSHAGVWSVPTVQLCVRDLGFPNGATADEFFAKAETSGLTLCPIEVGPFLRIQFLDQRASPPLMVASEKLSDEPDFPNGLYLRRLEDGLWLRGYLASDDWVFGPEDRFVFCSRP